MDHSRNDSNLESVKCHMKAALFQRKQSEGNAYREWTERTKIMITNLPLSLYPSAAAERISDGLLADALGLDVREVRAKSSFAKDLLISRAIEQGYIHSGWIPRNYAFSKLLDELSHAIQGHWSKLLTPVEREERIHVLFVLKFIRTRYLSINTTERQNHVQTRNHS